jgi:uncharacterized repeat protein (TIGR01451 family)
MTALLYLVPEPIPGQGPDSIPNYPCYRTVEETYAAAEQLVESHPGLAAWIDIGDSWEKSAGLGGYDLMVLKLTNQAIGIEKPKLWVMSSIHAREYTPAELATRFAEYLVDHYDVDPDITWLLDYHEIHLMLHGNPDGRKQAETGLSWRKNTNQNYCAPTSSNRGADLNRNYDFQWGCCNGSSGAPCDGTYRGPSPASEPETQAVQDYITAIFPDQRKDTLIDPAPANATGLFLDIHSYSNLVLWPWGFTAQAAPNGNTLRTLGRKFAYFNDYQPQQSYELYITDGTTDDYAYGRLGVAGYTFELGSAFFQSCSVFENTILPGNLPALVYAAKAARTPYLTPSGPDALGLTLSSGLVAAGEPLTLTATLDDTRFSANGGLEPSQNIAVGEITLDAPQWVTPTTPIAMLPVDGSFNNKVEQAYAVIDTSGWTEGRHTLFVRARDAGLNWGAESAVFIYVIDPEKAPTLRGQVIAADSGLPLPASLNAGGAFQTTTNPADGLYSLRVISGTYDLTASPASPAYAPAVAAGLTVQNYQTVEQDFVLYPYCTAFSDDVESGNPGWSAQAPWAITTLKAHSPTHAWTDSPAGSYANNLNVALTSPVIDLSGYGQVTLEFWQICDTEAGYDYCHVEVSADGGAAWSELAAYDGSHAQWEQVRLAAPMLENQPDARIRFRLTSDTGVTADGWYVDDIRLLGSSPACITPLAPQAAFQAASQVTVGQPLAFTNLSTGSLLAFAWDFGDGAASAGRNPQHVFQAPGVYTVTLTASNNLGSDQASQAIQVLGSPAGVTLQKTASLTESLPGGVVTYTLSQELALVGTHSYQLALTDTLPAGLDVLTATLTVNGQAAPGLYDPAAHTIAVKQSGVFSDSLQVTVVFQARLQDSLPAGAILLNRLRGAAAVDGLPAAALPEVQHSVSVIAPPRRILFLPLVR